MYHQFSDKKLEDIIFDMEYKFSTGKLDITDFARLRLHLDTILKEHTILESFEEYDRPCKRSQS